MDFTKFSDETKLILLCAKKDPGDADLSKIRQIVNKQLDWGFLWEQSLYHGASSFLYHHLKKQGLEDKAPADYLEKFRGFYIWVNFKNQALWEEFCNIEKALLQKNIKAVPIKGIALNQVLYEGKNIRPIGDIDILIQKSELPDAERVLLSSGYIKSTAGYSIDYYKKYHCHIPFRKRHLCEVHWAIALPRPHKIDLPDIWKNTREYNVKETKLTILSPEDNLFTLALHLNRFNSPLSLRYIMDVSEFINQYRNTIDWDYLIKNARANKIRSLLYFALYSAQDMLGAPVPKNILQELRPGLIRHKGLGYLIKNKTFSVNNKRPVSKKYLYLVLRYLIYDRAWHFISYIFFIPIEDFARFYSLPLNSRGTYVSYRLRVLYIFYRTTRAIIASIGRKTR
ncbi:MAG: nucleotidyltransferase family protein [Candidatus Omnitrophica bacterium]|nr:nucleotidyltransferase family protein [Candidatus Omnitrophota bacterium]